MARDDYDALTEFSSEEEDVPPLTSNEIDADAVSTAGRRGVPGQGDSVSAMRSTTSQHVRRAALFQLTPLRWVAASLTAFALGALVTWGVLRMFEPAPQSVAQNQNAPPAVARPSAPAPAPPEASRSDSASPAVVPPPEPTSPRQAASPPTGTRAPVVEPRRSVEGPAAAPSAAVSSSPAPSSPAPSVSAASVPAPAIETPRDSPFAVVEPDRSTPIPSSAPLPSIAVGAPPTVAPPAVSAESVAGRSRAALEEDAVFRTLQDYEQAYRTLDVAAAAEVWPSVDRRALARAFATLKSQGLALEQCEVSVAETIATARCRGKVEYVRKVGSPVPRVGHQEWLFKMRKLGTEWKIDQVEASQIPALSARGET